RAIRDCEAVVRLHLVSIEIGGSAADPIGQLMRIAKFLAFFILLALVATASAAQLRQVAMIDIPGRPGFDGLAFVGKVVVMAHGGAGTLDVFDPARRRVIAQVPGMSNPRGIAVDPAAGKVYVA